jgi:hypothetical protein
VFMLKVETMDRRRRGDDDGCETGILLRRGGPGRRDITLRKEDAL